MQKILPVLSSSFQALPKVALSRHLSDALAIKDRNITGGFAIARYTSIRQAYYARSRLVNARAASLVRKSGIKKRAADRLGVIFRDTAGANHIVPAVHLFLHLGNDFYCLFLFQEKARVLRNDI